MKTRWLSLTACVLVGCSSGTTGTGGGSGGGGGAGGSGGGAGGGAGSPDTLPAEYEAIGQQVIVASDGGVAIVGSALKRDSGTANDLLVTRFYRGSDGGASRDTAFGANGVALADFDGGASAGNILNFDGDFGASLAFDGEKIIAVGSARGEATGGYDLALARFNANGTLDPTFGTQGTVLKPFGLAAGGAQLNHVLVTSGGKYLVCGVSGTGQANMLFRFNGDGTADGTFAPGPSTLAADDGLCGTMMFQGPNILVTGRSLSIERYLAGGSVDATFGTAGSFSISGKLGAALQRTDGKIWLIGSTVKTISGSDTSFLKQALLTADGALDTTFGTSGIVETQYDLSQVRGAALQGDQAIIYIPSAPARLVRLNPDGSVDATFTAIPVPFKAPLLDPIFDPHHHLTIAGNTLWLTDLNVVNGVTRLGVFTTPLP